MSIYAWRVKRTPAGRLRRFVIMQTPDVLSMYRWLERSALARRLAPHTLWLATGHQPAILVERTTTKP